MSQPTTLIYEGEKKHRLDVFLAESYPDLSRSFLQRLCANDQVTVNGQAQRSGYKITPGDTVEVLYDMASIEKIEDIDLPILYQDDDVIVINKPSGVISHARGRFWNEPSVASFVRQLTDQQGERAGIVHRLDRPTSGVMICAKTASAMKFIQKQFADRSVAKTYQAVVSGEVSPEEAIIDMPIERNPKAPATFRTGANGKSAQTQYKVLDQNEAYTLLQLMPKTGRTHQLRVHVAHIKHPIVGDVLYGGEKYERLLLHATSLSLMLPDGTKKTFVAPVPEEFADYIQGDL
jgi:23S rRNA pseudouridine1911/1915/1917 synthase